MTTTPVCAFEVNIKLGIMNICRQIGEFEETTGSCVAVHCENSGHMDTTILQLTFANAGLAALFKLRYTP